MRRSVLIVFFAMFTLPLWGAVTFDAITNNGAVYGQASVTYSITVTSSNPYVLVASITRGDSTTSVTIGGVSATKLASQSMYNGGFWYESVWGIAGVSGTVDVVVSSSDSYVIQSSAISYSGAAQTGQPDAVEYSNTTAVSVGSTFSPVVTVGTANSTIVAFVEADNINSDTVTSGTQRGVYAELQKYLWADRGPVGLGSYGVSVLAGFSSTFDSIIVSIKAAPPPACTSASVSPSAAEVTSSSGSGSLSTTVSPSGCAWTPSSDSGWLTITAGQEVGCGSLAYSYTSNSGASRIGTVSAVGATFALTQSPPCTATFTPSSASVAATSGSGSVSVAVTPSGCLWSPVSDSSWLTVSVAIQTGDVSLLYSYAGNLGSSRVGNITVSGTSFSITQSALTPFSVSNVSATSTQAIIQYTSPAPGSCSLQVADMNRAISVASGTQASGSVTITTSAPHGLLSGAAVYLEGTGLWDGWQVLTGVASATTFTFPSAASGTASAGTVGVLVDDVNPALYSGADQDSRAGNIVNGLSRSFILGHHDAPSALDGNRYSQALQAGSRHHYTLTCGAYVATGDFSTRTLPFGNTHNDGIPVDRSTPGQYALSTITWSNQFQALIDPITGLRSVRTSGQGGAENTTVVGSCSTALVSGGYNCFSGSELVWVRKDGGEIHDLGTIHAGGPEGFANYGCGGDATSMFDRLDANTFFCMGADQGFVHTLILMAHYNGSHQDGTNGVDIPHCVANGNVQPCVTITSLIQVDTVATAFSSAFRNSGYVIGYWIWVGGSGATDDIVLSVNEGSQDTKGWIFVVGLGDRTPYGTNSSSVNVIAAASTYQTAPWSWCTIHDTGTTDNGWLNLLSNSFESGGDQAGAAITLTSATLNTTPGIAGGMNTCPINPFGVTGQNCTAITVSAEPSLQASQAGDLIRVDGEYLRILVKTGSTNWTVQRGFNSTAASHGGSAMAMACGTLNPQNSLTGLWNYVSDPHETNATGTTVISDAGSYSVHSSSIDAGSTSTAGVELLAGYGNCDPAINAPWGCYRARIGHLPMVPETDRAIAGNPGFANVVGTGDPNGVNSHPGFCTSMWCLDSRSMLGGGSGTTLGSVGTPFVNIVGQLWKCAGCGSVLHRKVMSTMAYVGRFPLVDVSGPSSSIGTTSAGSYTWCHALAPGECYPGSAAGDVYVNAPGVVNGYCNYYSSNQPASADICVGDIGAGTGYLTQVGISANDEFGTNTRRLGISGRWQGQYVFAIAYATLTGEVLLSNNMALDGSHSANLISFTPPSGITDSQNRGSFIPVDVRVPALAGVSTAEVEFGYDPSFHCTSRQEACEAVASAIGSTPFYWASETFSQASCASGCTIQVPALADRVIYYRIKYGNGVVGLTTPGVN